MDYSFIAKTEQDWAKYAKILVPTLSGGEVFGLSGPLGAGKTALVAAVAKELGVAGPVLSPTFVLVKNYPVSGRKFSTLCHADLYRAAEGEVPEALAEWLGDPHVVCFVEWAQKARAALPKGAMFFSIDILPKGHRRITKSRPE